MALIRLFAYYRILVGDDRMQNGFVFLYVFRTQLILLRECTYLKAKIIHIIIRLLETARKSDCFFGIANRGVAADSFVPVILLDGDVGIVFARIQ